MKYLTTLLFVLLVVAGCARDAAPAPTETAVAIAEATEEPLAASKDPTQAPDSISPTSEPTDGAQATPVEAVMPSPTTSPVASIQGESKTQCSGLPTPANPEGPFYTPNTPERANLIEEDLGGEPIRITGQVLTTKCEPIAGAMVDFWQTDAAGEYDNVGYRMRGHQFSDENGRYQLETIIPGEYPGRTPHIHVKIFAPDGGELLTTQLYIPGVSDQTPDGIGGFRPDLLVQELPSADGWRQMAFDFVVATDG